MLARVSGHGHLGLPVTGQDADSMHQAPDGNRPLVARRTQVALLLVVLAAGFASYLTMTVAVIAPRLPVGMAARYWRAAAVSAAVIILVDLLCIGIALRRRPRAPWQRSPVLFVCFLALTVLQLGHVGEHVVQVTQLLVNHGVLSRSHGLVGQLDFETVHFIWDGLIWLALGALLTRFATNRWLWLSFLAASVHQMEHGYLFWLYMTHRDFYLSGGWAGILGLGGVIGSPLYRPYLHFLYNVAVVAPLVLAFWQQVELTLGRRCRAYEQFLRTTAPELSDEAQLVARQALQRKISYL
jgi:hypothetical protein